MTRTTIAVLGAFLDAGSDGRLYGLEIMASAGIKSGTLYPILDRLEDAKWIVGEWEQIGEDVGRPRRRYYSLTGPGVQAAHRALAVHRPIIGVRPVTA